MQLTRENMFYTIQGRRFNLPCFSAWDTTFTQLCSHVCVLIYVHLHPLVVAYPTQNIFSEETIHLDKSYCLNLIKNIHKSLWIKSCCGQVLITYEITINILTKNYIILFGSSNLSNLKPQQLKWSSELYAAWIQDNGKKTRKRSSLSMLHKCCICMNNPS